MPSNLIAFLQLENLFGEKLCSGQCAFRRSPIPLLLLFNSQIDLYLTDTQEIYANEEFPFDRMCVFLFEAS